MPAQFACLKIGTPDKQPHSLPRTHQQLQVRHHTLTYGSQSALGQDS